MTTQHTPMRLSEQQYLMLTPKGVFEAFSMKKPSAEQLALQALLSSSHSMTLAQWTEQFPIEWLAEFSSLGCVQYLGQELTAPNLPLDQFLPYVVASLSGQRRAAIGSSEGFCLARVGYSQEEADTLSVAAADFSDFLVRQQQRGWAVQGKAVSFFNRVDLLMPSTSFVFLWMDGQGYTLILDSEPLTNNRAFVELVWAIKTSGLKFDQVVQEAIEE